MLSIYPASLTDCELFYWTFLTTARKSEILRKFFSIPLSDSTGGSVPHYDQTCTGRTECKAGVIMVRHLSDALTSQRTATHRSIYDGKTGYVYLSTACDPMSHAYMK